MDGWHNRVSLLLYTYTYVTHEKVQQRPRISSTHSKYERIYRGESIEKNLERRIYSLCLCVGMCHRNMETLPEGIASKLH